MAAGFVSVMPSQHGSANINFPFQVVAVNSPIMFCLQDMHCSWLVEARHHSIGPIGTR
uniref:Uncharacterized protein n=1 Tax=Rhizophora mucronata TaxID=61149 RepID=A0A2P2IUF4_RHIMU